MIKIFDKKIIVYIMVNTALGVSAVNTKIKKSSNYWQNIKSIYNNFTSGGGICFISLYYYSLAIAGFFY